MVGKIVTSTRALTLDGKLPVVDVPKFELILKGGYVQKTTDNASLGSQTTTSYRSDGSLPDDNVVDRARLKELVQSSTDKFNRPYDTGHEFFTEKRFKYLSHRDYHYYDKFQKIGFSGPLRVNSSAKMPPLPPIDKNYYGNKAISILAPTASEGLLVQDAAELLKDGLILTGGSGFADWLKSRTSFARASGSEYLNVAFGWQPTISALNREIVSLQNATKIMTQLRSDSNKWVRRNLTFPEIVTTTEGTQDNVPKVNVGFSGSNIDGPYWNPLYQGGNSGRIGTTRSHVITNQKIWFSGAFQYYLNPGNSLMDRLERYMTLSDKVLGLRMTPETLWQLAPWSWLVDWFVDISSALKAQDLQTNDGLVLKYGYLMRRTIRSVEKSTSVQFAGQKPIDVSSTDVIITKERFKSTPFGFGLNPNSFSEYQWTILAALGLSRGGRSMWL